MTKVLGIIGNPVAKSFSPTYFNEKFKRQKIDYQYKRFQLNEISEVEDVFSKEKQLVGFNVTSPFKESIIPFLDDCSDESLVLNSVNTVKIVDGRRIGYNTDIIGFEATLKSLGVTKEHCMVLGSGGAASAVKYVLSNRGIQFIQISRTPRNGMIGYDTIDQELVKKYSVIINTTTLGMSHQLHLKPKLPYRHISENNLFIDLIYEPRVTAFLLEGLNRGARIKNGFEMLIQQAEASWNIWSHTS